MSVVRMGATRRLAAVGAGLGRRSAAPSAPLAPTPAASGEDDAVVELPCYYSLSSPWAYLGGPQLEQIVKRHGCRLLLKPFDFQDVAPQNGGVPIRTRPEPRRSYHTEELARWRDHLDVPMHLEPRHYPQQMPEDPDWNKYAGWMVIAAQLEGVEGLEALALSHALLRALWAEQRDIAEPGVRIAVANAQGLDGPRLQALETADETQAVYAVRPTVPLGRLCSLATFALT